MRRVMGRWAEILTLYRWELRSAFRDRTIVVNSVVLPIVLYPALLWVTFTGITFVQGQTADLASRVAVVGLPAEEADLLRRLDEHERVEVVEAPPPGALEEEIREGRLDAALEVAPGDAERGGGFHARLLYDGSRERSAAARGRVADLVREHREAWQRREALARGVEPAAWAAFGLERRNVASARQLGALLLGLVPLFFVVMVALGCLYPAIDTTAGERERGTWETLMATAASRTSIVAAKYLAVTTIGGLAGLLNLAAMLLTFRAVLGPVLERGERVEFAVPATALPLLLGGAVLLAGLLAAGMMLLASFAHTFREGQSAASAFYMAAIVPVIFLSDLDIQLTLPLAFVPVANVALVVREALRGTFDGLEVLAACGASLAYIFVLVRLAAFVLAVENIVIGSYSGSLLSFLRDRLRRRAAAAAGGRS
jgi:sodium transport system permease protein